LIYNQPPFHPSEVGELSTSLPGWGQSSPVWDGSVYCDLLWQMMFHGSE